MQIRISRSIRSRRVDREPLADHAADRQPAVGGALQARADPSARARRGRARRSYTGRPGPASGRGPDGRSGSSRSVPRELELRLPHRQRASRANRRAAAAVRRRRRRSRSEARRPSSRRAPPAPGRSALRTHRVRSSVSRAPSAPEATSRSRFARIRSGSTIRFSSSSRDQAAADPTSPSSSRCTPHSACHAPAARSCSCSIAAEHVTRPGRARAWCRPAPRPTRPGCACGPSRSSRHARDRRPRCTSATSCWASSVTSRAIFGEHARERPEPGRQGGRPHPDRLPWQRRLGQAQLRGNPAGDRRGPGADRSAHLYRELRVADLLQAAVGGVEAGQPRCGPQPERDRQRLLQQRPPDHRRAPMGVGEPSGRVGTARGRRPAAARARGRRSASAPCRRCPGWWRRDGRRRHAPGRPRPATRPRARRPASRASRFRRASAAASKRPTRPTRRRSRRPPRP